ncbi:MAG TPA: low temperature requirement protein A [Solirubrobacteraceae bacterium]|nr:low temperature requirement protein A [Solirubrobacteraceae bacterium]
MSGAAYEESGTRVSWVELYLDLVFVLAVAQLAHLMVAEPETGSVWIALGLFFVLWWTWIGFAVLYNRRGDDAVSARLLFLAASVPVGIAAVAIEPASRATSPSSRSRWRPCGSCSPSASQQGAPTSSTCARRARA